MYIYKLILLEEVVVSLMNLAWLIKGTRQSGLGYFWSF